MFFTLISPMLIIPLKTVMTQANQFPTRLIDDYIPPITTTTTLLLLQVSVEEVIGKCYLIED